jgi:Family of unknown function (DUF5999)
MRRESCISISISISLGARSGRHRITWPHGSWQISRQGWSLLCNGVILFDGGGELLPDRRAAAPERLGLTGLAAMAA